MRCQTIRSQAGICQRLCSGVIITFSGTLHTSTEWLIKTLYRETTNVLRRPDSTLISNENQSCEISVQLTRRFLATSWYQLCTSLLLVPWYSDQISRGVLHDAAQISTNISNRSSRENANTSDLIFPNAKLMRVPCATASGLILLPSTMDWCSKTTIFKQATPGEVNF